ncbi:hypothetical protein ACM66B_003745 [Microbotryomycetes sp. NB124-2]
MTSRSVRIACLQLSPVFKDVEASQERADVHVNELEPRSIDLLVLPEMAFTGYNFTSRSDIEPWLERAASGKSYTWASRTALRLGCYVFVGFPERSNEDKAFNSMLVVNPDGQLVTVYQKHFLYTTDETWANEGPGFSTIKLDLPPTRSSPKRTIKVCPAICMDLNPRKFQAPFGAFELARYAVEQRVDLVVCSMAWLASSSEPGELSDNNVNQVEERKVNLAATEQLLRYWLLRCAPLIASEHETVFVACNRVGREGDVVFGGSSCVLHPRQFQQAFFASDDEDEEDKDAFEKVHFSTQCHANDVDETMLLVNAMLPD